MTAQERIAQARADREARQQQRATDRSTRLADIMARRDERRAARGVNTGGGNAATSAYDTWKDSTGYQARLNEGLDAVNANWAARGALESGAAQKSLLEYGQTFASNDIYPYMGMLGNVMTQGTGAASAMAGAAGQYGQSMGNLNSAYAANLANAGTNLAGTVTGLNANLAGAQGTAATNIGGITGNAAIANANNSAGVVQGIGNALGGVAGYYAYN